MQSIQNLPQAEQIKVLLAALEAEKAKNTKPFTLKVSEKGCVSVYGLQRFPVNLYAEQWERIFKEQDKIKTFIQENSAKLARK